MFPTFTLREVHIPKFGGNIRMHILEVEDSYKGRKIRGRETSKEGTGIIQAKRIVRD